MKAWQYCYQGLGVCSEIPLPEWSAFESDSAQSDVVIRVGGSGGDPNPAQRLYRVPVERIGCFLVRNGREIVLVPEHLTGKEGFPSESNSSEARRMRAFLLGSAWGALLYQRGEMLIHASAVGTERGVVAFCGRRGAGKSTLAACLADRGYPLVSDDVCMIRTGADGVARVVPSIPRFKLCRDAAEVLGWDQAELQPELLPSGKYLYPSERGESHGGHPLYRIYLPAWGAPEIHRIRGFAALSRLTSAGTWRGDILMETGDPAAHFGQCVELLRKVECWEFRRSRDLGSLAKQVDTLERHLAGDRPVPGLC